MKLRIGCVVVGFLSLVLSLVQLPFAQTPTQTASALPRLVRFAGTAKDLNGNPLTGVVGITFALYSEQTGGASLWLEAQNVTADSNGHYTALLGSTKPDGLPADLFTSEQAHWVGVQVSGQEEQPRVLLVSAPYALKAGDAETIGGLPPSAFVMAAPQTGTAATEWAVTARATSSLTPNVAGTGRTDFIPLWTSSTGKLGNSVMFQSGTGNTAKIGINTITPAEKLEVDLGNLFVKGTGNFKAAGDTAYVYVGDTSHPIEAIYASGLAIGAYEVPQAIFIQDKTGNVGMAANLTVNGNLSATGVVTGSGFQIGSNLFDYGSYANENAFLGFAGNTTMTGTNNTAVGVGALSSNTTGHWNTASGWGALYNNTASNWNTAIGSLALYKNTTGNNTAIGAAALYNNTTGSNIAIGGSALYNNTTGTANTAIGGYALSFSTTGNYNTASGEEALWQNTTGSQNTASGISSLQDNTTGNSNTASGYLALWQNTTGNYNTALGWSAGPDSTNLSYATAIGAGAVVSQSKALVLGGPLGSGANVSVGIGTATPSNVFTIAKTAGLAISDGWATYSSRRWKTNIRPIHNALGMVEQLRGVSYDLKGSGKHEIGVIAEEVGAVVPEVVSYEENGKDARGVDYSRLTALLIEAVKQQQREIRDLKSELRATRQTLQKVKAQVAAAQPALAAK